MTRARLTNWLMAIVWVQAMSAIGATESKPESKHSHDLIIGARQLGDRLVYQESVVKPYSLLRIVEVKKTFVVARNYLITQVQALDEAIDGNGAIATRVGGGLGHDNVTLKFTSQRGYGIDFKVIIYARSKLW